MDFDYYDMPKRFKETVKFIDRLKEPVLDIGPKNPFGKRLANYFGIYRHNTSGDLDKNDWWPEKRVIYETVFCFEALEHLMNPNQFLDRLSGFISDSATVYISYPHHLCSRFWSPTHFHEYDEKRIEHLLCASGYEVLRHDYYVMWPRLNGVRPILRFLSFKWALYLSRRHFYELRLKHEQA